MSDDGTAEKAWQAWQVEILDYRHTLDAHACFMAGRVSRDAEVAEAKLLTDEWANAAHKWSSEVESLREQLAKAREESGNHYRNALEWKFRAVEAQATIEKVRELHHEGVAYADDVDEATDVPDDYERHFCHEDGGDWPCSTINALSAPSSTGGNDE